MFATQNLRKINHKITAFLNRAMYAECMCGLLIYILVNLGLVAKVFKTTNAEDSNHTITQKLTFVFIITFHSE